MDDLVLVRVDFELVTLVALVVDHGVLALVVARFPEFFHDFVVVLLVRVAHQAIFHGRLPGCETMVVAVLGSLLFDP